MKKVLSLLMLLLVVGMVSATNPNPGSIWTTLGDCGASAQDVNHYEAGDKVFINGANFNAATYAWDIRGNPYKDADIVASGTHNVGSNGSFCFEAYTVQNDDSGEYSVNFGKKNDNYHVDATQVPEFGVVAGAVALVGALGIFLFRRK